MEFVNDAPLSFALRRMRRAYRAPRALAALAVVVSILTLSGPFGTLDTLSILPRFGYWSAIAITTFGAGIFATALAAALVPDGPVRIATAAVACGLAATLCVVLLNAILLGIGPGLVGEDGTPTAIVFAVAALIALALDLALPDTPPAQAPAAPVVQQPRVLTRLAPDKRGALISLSVQDHYVLVVTTRGDDLVLIRLGDAIAETAPVPGLQIHRSHWVARDHVASVVRKGDRAEVVLSDGRRLPASRSRLPALREAGLL